MFFVFYRAVPIFTYWTDNSTCFSVFGRDCSKCGDLLQNELQTSKIKRFVLNKIGCVVCLLYNFTVFVNANFVH